MAKPKNGPGPRPSPQHELVHTKFVRLKNGRVLLAEHYGLRCFTFWAKPRK